MRSRRYTILGYLVWHGGRWYLRRRLRMPLARPARGARAVRWLLVLGAVGVAVVAARRLAG
jgi:hypothetical protein